MKRFLLSLVILLCLYVPALSQKVRVFGTAGQTQNIRSQSSTVPVLRTFPSCTITVFNTGTLTLTSIWTDASGSTPQANPFTANADATYGFFATAGAVVDVRISGTGVTTPFTISSITVTGGGGGGGGGGDALTSNPLSQFAATTPAQLQSVITQDTGSGALVFGTSPAITTPTGIVKGDVGLGNVDNTSDATKNAATANLTNKTIDGDLNTVLDLPANTVFKSGTRVPIANLATGTPTGSKFIRDDGTLQTIPGGGDALTSNPLSQFAATTSAQFAGVISDETGTGSVVLSVSPAFTGTPTAPTAVAATNTTQIATTAHVFAERTNTATLTNKTLTSPTINSAVMSNPTGITKSNVGLSNVDNTSDATKNSASVTLTNKTISGASNTLSNIAQASVTSLVSDLAGKQSTLTNSAGLAAAISDETGTGVAVFGTSPTIATPALTFRTQANNTAIVANSAYRNTSDGKFYIGANDGLSNQEIFVAGVSGPVSVSNGGNGLVGNGGTVASATTVTITGTVTHISGTTTITSVSGTGHVAGHRITLIFDGILTFTDGSNLKLAGDFVTSADDSITLVFDGTNWYEVARSVN